MTAPTSITVGAGEPFGWSPFFSKCAAAQTGGSCPTPTTPETITWTTTLPVGVTMLHAGWPGNPGVLDNCLSNCSYTFGGETDRGYDYTLVNAAPGDYDLTAAITSTSEPDPDTANNIATTVVHVVPLSLKLKTAASGIPRTGKRFVWSLELISLASGADVQPSRVSCLAHIGPKPLRGKATVAQGDRSGRLACVWLVPTKSEGKRLVTQVKASLAAVSASLNHTFTIHA